MENNKLQLFFGFLGKDPYLAYTPKNLDPVCEISLGIKNENNFIEWKKIVVFGKLAELCKVHLRKGNEVFVRGRIRNRSMRDSDGNERVVSDFLVHSVALELFKI